MQFVVNLNHQKENSMCPCWFTLQNSTSLGFYPIPFLVKYHNYDRCSIFSVSQLTRLHRSVGFGRWARKVPEKWGVFLGPRQVAGTSIYLQEKKEKGARKHQKSCSWSRISAILLIFSQIFDTFSQVTACWKDRYPLGIGPNPPALQQYRLHPEVIHPPQWACYPCCRTHPRAWLVHLLAGRQISTWFWKTIREWRLILWHFQRFQMHLLVNVTVLRSFP